MKDELLDKKHIHMINEAINYATETGSFNKLNLIHNAENVCVFGLGRFFEEAFEKQNVKEKYHVKYLCDNNPDKVQEVSQRQGYTEGLKCINPGQLKEIQNVVVITMIGDPRSVNKQLDEMGIQHITHTDLTMDVTFNAPVEKSWFKEQREKIIEAYYLLDDDESRKIYTNILCLRIAPHLAEYSYEELCSQGEYFKHGLFELNDNESYVDCGAFNGDSVKLFTEAVHDKFNRVYAFELDNKNFKELSKNIQQMQCHNKIECFNYGVWDTEKNVTYGGEDECREGISLYKETGNMQGKIVRLDDILKGRDVSLIKMDIEGAEQKALEGARNIILKQTPKLAICLYHKVDDLWKVPLYLKKIVPKYRINIRHHFYVNVWGTVCYACID